MIRGAGEKREVKTMTNPKTLIRRVAPLCALAAGIVAAGCATQIAPAQAIPVKAAGKTAPKAKSARSAAKTTAKKRVAQKARVKTKVAARPAMKKVVAPVVAQAAPKKEAPPVLKFTMKNLQGRDVDLSRYAGKVVMVVNTASKCGHTPQYAGLQKLHEQYGGKGLAILGFPANDFGQQEPGSDSEISLFCEANFGVKFDMFSKVPVTGENKAPLFKYLTSPETNPQSPGEIGWNFEKFLIGRDGTILARFKSGVKPESEEIKNAVEAALKA
jgi:glutathione peroxidase